MTDRELLELAAKAAGREVWTGIDGNLYTTMNDLIEKPWNPLTDDGDALRLAVRLGILLRTDFIKILAQLLDSGMDHQKATRRAIVRAAAEIGRNME